MHGVLGGQVNCNSSINCSIIMTSTTNIAVAAVLTTGSQRSFSENSGIYTTWRTKVLPPTLTAQAKIDLSGSKNQSFAFTGTTQPVVVAESITDVNFTLTNIQATAVAANSSGAIPFVNCDKSTNCRISYSNFKIAGASCSGVAGSLVTGCVIDFATQSANPFSIEYHNWFQADYTSNAVLKATGTGAIFGSTIHSQSCRISISNPLVKATEKQRFLLNADYSTNFTYKLTGASMAFISCSGCTAS